MAIGSSPTREGYNLSWSLGKKVYHLQFISFCHLRTSALLPKAVNPLTNELLEKSPKVKCGEIKA